MVLMKPSVTLPTREGRAFPLTLSASPFHHHREASCPMHIQSQVVFAMRQAHRSFWEYFPDLYPGFCICRCTHADPSSCPFPLTKKITYAFFFPLHPLEMKDANWEAGFEYLEKTALSITHWYDPGYREGPDCHQCWWSVRPADLKQEEGAQSISDNYAAISFFLLQGQIFVFWWWSWSATLAKSEF